MPKPNVIVSSVLGFNPPLEQTQDELLRSERGLSVEFEGERSVRLDPADPRSAGFLRILDGLRKQKLPVYLELDPDTSTIARLFIPFITRITGIYQIDEALLGVTLEHSHGRHTLRRDAPDFDELEKHLREKLRTGDLAILTENDAHEIIDIRDYRPALGEPPVPFPEPYRLPPKPWWYRCLRWLWNFLRWIYHWLFCCISKTKAQQVFDALKATSCDPLTVPPPCIPFLYPDDGCWGRAHEMCRLMIKMGLKPKKVWIQGSLFVPTKNNTNCGVHWGWHVAPTLCVRGTSIFQAQEMVIDPSLFNNPVTKAAWKNVQSDPNATLTNSTASIFYLWGSVTDPNYVQTNQVLATYRLKLQNRALQFGAPPYANC